MKKFFMALVLVLCMALPAMAGTTAIATSASNDADLRAAVEDTNVDTIIISGNINLTATEQGPDYRNCGLYVSSDRTLTLQINKNCKLSLSGTCLICNTGTLTIKGEGSLSATDNGPKVVQVPGGTVNIVGDVSIVAEGGQGADAIYVNGGTVNIADNVSLTATSLYQAHGVYVYSGGTANILSAKYISGSGGSGSKSVYNNKSNLTVYGGTFSDDSASSYLGPDSTDPTQSGDTYVVTNSADVKLTPSSLDVIIGEVTSFGVALLTSKDVECGTLDTLTISPASSDSTTAGIKATASSADKKISFDVPSTVSAGNQYDFIVECSDNSSTKHWKTKTFTVTVTKPAETSQIVFGSNPVSIAKGSNLDMPVSIKYGTQTLSADITNISAPTGLTVTSKDSAINIAVASDCASGDHTVTVTATSGAHTASADLKVTVTDTQTPAPAPTPVNNLPGDPKFNEEENVVQGTSKPYEDKSVVSEMKNDMDENAFNDNEIIISNGKAKVSEETAATAINNTSGGKATSGDIISFPIVKVTTDSTSDDLTILATFIVSGDQLTYAKTPDNIRVYKIFDGKTSERVKYVKETRNAKNRNFTVLDKDGNPATEIKSGENYYISIYVADNDTYDLDDGTVGQIIDPIAIDTSATTSSSGSSGCNAGFGALALAALAVIAAKQRKK